MPTVSAPASKRSKRPVKGHTFSWKLLLLLAVAGVLFLFLRPYLLSSKSLPPVLEEDWITVDLLPENPYSRPQIPLKQVNGVVVHYTGNPNTSAEANRSYFASLAQSGATYASSHFIIGIDGKIIQCIPLNEIAYCSNSRNDDTISIECCHPDQSGQFSDATYQSLVKLVRYLADGYGLSSDDVIRHYDVTGKLCPYYYATNPEAWEAFKKDVFSPSLF